MTIAATPRRAGPYDGDDSTVEFPFAFKVFTADDVLVVLTSAAGVDTEQVLDSDYTIDLNEDQNSSPGGTVTMLTAPATGKLLTILSDVAYSQELDVQNLGGFFAESFNDAFDRDVMMIQQLAEEVGRAVKVGVSEGDTTAEELLNSLHESVADAAASADSAAAASATVAADAAAAIADVDAAVTAAESTLDAAVAAAEAAAGEAAAAVAGVPDFTFLRNTVVETGMMAGFNYSVSGGTAEQPLHLFYKRLTEWIKVDLTWGTTGGENGNVTKMAFYYSSNSGISYTPIADGAGSYVCTLSYDSNSNCTDTLWGAVP